MRAEHACWCAVSSATRSLGTGHVPDKYGRVQNLVRGTSFFDLEACSDACGTGVVLCGKPCHPLSRYPLFRDHSNTVTSQISTGASQNLYGARPLCTSRRAVMRAEHAWWCAVSSATFSLAATRASLVQGSGFRVQGSGCRVQGSGIRVHRAGFRVQGSGFRVQGSGFRVQGSGFRIQGSGFRI